jgi:hypothetical protein
MTSADNPTAIRELNMQNQEFWRMQSNLTRQRISEPIIAQLALSDLRSELTKGIPIRLHKTLEQALADLTVVKTRLRKLCHSEFSRKGGRAPKVNALNKLIEGLVYRDPTINVTQLLHGLRKSDDGVITSIDSTEMVLAGDCRRIHFVNDDGKPKSVPVSGLKDRLSRIKAKNKIAPTG